MPLRILFLLFGLLTFQSEASSHSGLISGCSVHDLKGKLLRTFPGRLCFFTNAGNLVSLSPSGLRLLTPPDGEVKWERTGFGPQARIVLSPEGDRILLLEEKRLLVLDLAGTTLFEKISQVSYSSFYQIPGREKLFLVNIPGDAAYVLSPDLQEVVKKIPLGNNVDDVQAENDHRLFYLNRSAGSRPDVLSSAYEEYDLLKQRVVFRFPKKPSGAFMNTFGGGVFRTDDQIVVTHSQSGSYFISRRTKKLLDFLPDSHMQASGFLPVQRVRLEDLTEVMKLWRSP